MTDVPLNEEGVDHTAIKPEKKDYDNFDEYWEGLCKYLDVKFKKTYSSEKK